MPRVHASTMATVDTIVGKIGFTEERIHEENPIIFLHGVGSDKSVWRPQIGHFGQVALSEELAGLIPGAKLNIISGASHLANLDKPADFNLAIDDFLSGINHYA